MSEPLATYLHDHLAGARFAIDLLERLRDTQPSQDFKDFAQHLLRQIEEDREVLQRVVDDVAGGRSAVKEAAAWLSEKASRLKLRLGGNEALAVFESLEALSLGVLGKAKLWQALSEISAGDPRLEQLDLTQLIARAESQHDAIESRRRKLAAVTFTMT
jgi:hypothetical protein